MHEAPAFVVGRFAVFDEIASGGMARVHLGRLLGAEGFSRTVAIKRIHPQLAEDPEFVAMFLDEARLMGRIRHANVVQVLDVMAAGGVLAVAMEYVHGASLSRLISAAQESGELLDCALVAKVMVDVLRGLHEAHETKSELGQPLGVVHRDVTPHNILVGVDGSARVADFGIAKASHRAQTTTREGQLKGKLGYMAPEQLRHEHFDRRTDIYAASVVLWEALTGTRLFQSGSEGRQLTKILFEPVVRPRTLRADLSQSLEDVVMRGLDRDAQKRFATAREMALAIEEAIACATSGDVGATVERLAAGELARLASRIAEIEKDGSAVHPAPGLSTATLSPNDATRLEAVAMPHLSHPRWRGALGLLVLVACVAMAAAGLLWASAGHSGARTTSAASVPEPIVGRLPTASAASQAAQAAPSSGTPELKDDPPNSEAGPPRHASAPTVSPTRRTWASAPGATKAGCNPPFRVDSAGIRHLKPECM